MGNLLSVFRVDASVSEVWDLHRNPAVLKRISPPGLVVRLPDPAPEPQNGVRFTLTLHPLGIPWGIAWESIFSDVDPPYRFVDTQGRGPFAQWRHEHRFESLADGGTRILETVEWVAPLGWIGRIADVLFLKPMLTFTFAYRRMQLTRLLKRPG